MYKAEERSYRVCRVTWDTIKDGAKNYPVLEGKLGGDITSITVDLNSFDPDGDVEIDLLDTGRSFMMTLDECVKHGYFSRICELKCTIVETVYRAYGSHDQVHSSIRIHFTMTTLQLIRTLKPDDRVVLPGVICTALRWKDALDSDISGLEETEIMALGHINTATGALRFDSDPYGIALDVAGHVTPSVMTIIEKESLRRWDVLVSDFCQVIRKYNGKDSDEGVAVIFDVEAKKIRQILVPGDRARIQAYGLDRRVMKERARTIMRLEDYSMDENTRRYMAVIASIRSYGLAKAHSGRYPWGSDEFAQTVPGIKKVYFNKPATVVIWEDGSKTIVKCQPGEKYDAEKGLAMAIAKKALGNTGKWYDTFKKELPKPKKRSSAKKGATYETA